MVAADFERPDHRQHLIITANTTDLNAASAIVGCVMDITHDALRNTKFAEVADIFHRYVTYIAQQCKGANPVQICDWYEHCSPFKHLIRYFAPTSMPITCIFRLERVLLSSIPKITIVVRHILELFEHVSILDSSFSHIHVDLQRSNVCLVWLWVCTA